jgi:ring-1,2-phenylacetyl-CoA epoxidase subunit PaaE
MFREELDDLKDRYLTRLSLVHILSREAQDIDLLHGRITGERHALNR